MLSHNDLSIYEIASKCGYNTVSFFISTYKQRYGITPDIHRQILLKNKLNKSRLVRK